MIVYRTFDRPSNLSLGVMFDLTGAREKMIGGSYMPIEGIYTSESLLGEEFIVVFSGDSGSVIKFNTGMSVEWLRAESCVGVTGPDRFLFTWSRYIMDIYRGPAAFQASILSTVIWLLALAVSIVLGIVLNHYGYRYPVLWSIGLLMVVTLVLLYIKNISILVIGLVIYPRLLWLTITGRRSLIRDVVRSYAMSSDDKLRSLYRFVRYLPF